MKTEKILKLFVLIALLLINKTTRAQNSENWTNKQLIEPAELAQALNSGKEDVPVIISVGPGAPIPNSIEMGMARDKENIDKLKKELSSRPKETAIVIYCGCCPFDRCPNVRPAIDLLKDMKFANYKLLNLPHNVKTDWIDKGYPVVKQ